jgi:hypothetical protein
MNTNLIDMDLRLRFFRKSKSDLFIILPINGSILFGSVIEKIEMKHENKAQAK